MEAILELFPRIHEYAQRLAFVFRGLFEDGCRVTIFFYDKFREFVIKYVRNI